MAGSHLAMALHGAGEPLRAERRPRPELGPGDVLIEVFACGVCRTDLHIIDGDLPLRKSPIVPGHEIVGRVAALGQGVSKLGVGDRVGVPWLGRTCGRCRYCEVGAENLCDAPEFTGWSRDGGFAEFCVADERFAFRLPDAGEDAALAPLLCAGLIGFRALRFAEDAETVGLYGFGAAAHIAAQVLAWQGRTFHALTRPGDHAAQDLALSLGAASAGDSDVPPPEELDAAILFAPVGALVPAALKAVRKGGVVVCGGIHMSDIPRFPYADLWGERTIRSVANLTRADAEDFLALVGPSGVTAHVTTFPLEEADEAVRRLRAGELVGAAVLLTEAGRAARSVRAQDGERTRA